MYSIAVARHALTQRSRSHGYENRHSRTVASDACCYGRVLLLLAYVCMLIRLPMFSGLFVCLFVCFLHDMSKTMQLESPNWAWIWTTVSPGNTLILGSKDHCYTYWWPMYLLYSNCRQMNITVIVFWYSMPCVGPGQPPLSLHFPTFPPSTLFFGIFYFSLFPFLALSIFFCFSIPSHSITIVPLRFQARCFRRRLNPALRFLCVLFCVICIFG